MAPVFFAMSPSLANPGDDLADAVAGIPLLVVRQYDGGPRALVNAYADCGLHL